MLKCSQVFWRPAVILRCVFYITLKYIKVIQGLVSSLNVCCHFYVCALFGLGFSHFHFLFFSSFPVCRLKVIRGRWFTYILRDLVVHFLRIYIVVVVGTCVMSRCTSSVSWVLCVS